MSEAAAWRACAECQRTTWLVSQLSSHHEYLRRREGGDLLTVFELTDEQLLAVARRYEKLAATPRLYRRFDARAADAASRRAGVAAVCRHEPSYPLALAGLRSAPPVIYCAGDHDLVGELLAAPTAAIVGARRASDYALEVTAALASGLASAGVTVVSGMADGVDSAAHRGALEAGGATIAVLGGSAHVAYPSNKRPLHRRLVRDAAVLSEWPPDFRPRPWCFVARNRVIAGLAAATIVVEAGERSGSLTTARFAESFSRAVGAVPGRVTSDMAIGSNGLLFDGAHMVRDARDALELVCGHSLPEADLAGALARVERARRTAIELPEPLKQLLSAIEQGNDAQATLFELPDAGPRLLADLSRLELLGLVRRAPGGRYVRTATRANRGVGEYAGLSEERAREP